MNAITADIWSNEVGWHWHIDCDDVDIESGRTFKTEEDSRWHMKEAAQRLRIKLGKITVNWEG